MKKISPRRSRACRTARPSLAGLGAIQTQRAGADGLPFGRRKILLRHVGKPPQMNACLKANKANLSDACRKVVELRGG